MPEAEVLSIVWKLVVAMKRFLKTLLGKAFVAWKTAWYNAKVEWIAQQEMTMFRMRRAITGWARFAKARIAARRRDFCIASCSSGKLVQGLNESTQFMPMSTQRRQCSCVSSASFLMHGMASFFAKRIYNHMYIIFVTFGGDEEYFSGEM